MLLSINRGFLGVRHLSTAIMSRPGPKAYPADVTIVEVGPRDGLQNEKVYTK